MSNVVARRALRALGVLLSCTLIGACSSASGSTASQSTTARPNTSGCIQTAPAGASAEARAYLAAANAATPGWLRVSKSLQAEHYRIYRNDVVAQFNVDSAFLTRLDSIHFTGRAVAPEAKFRQALYEYVSLMWQMARKPGSQDNAYLGRLDNERAEASAELRSALGLPSSDCPILRP